jgi:hypothetical protein
MWVLVVLAVLTIVIGLVTWQSVTGLRQTDKRHYQIQARWLARAGVERAAARLLASPTGYSGETVALLPGSQVRIAVTKDKDRPDTFLVTCEARYPADGREQVVRSQSRRFRRAVDKDQVRLEVVAPDPSMK